MHDTNVLHRLCRSLSQRCLSLRSLSLHCLAWSCLMLGACGELPDSRRIENPRILALRTEVISTWLPGDDPDPRARADALPYETVALLPYAVSPTGVLDLSTGPALWLVCELLPGEGISGCARRLAKRGITDVAALPECSEPSLDLLNDVQSLPAEVAPCKITAPIGKATTFIVPPSLQQFAGADLELTLFAPTAGGPTPAACAQDYLKATRKLDRQCLMAVQRLEVGPDQTLLQVAQRLNEGGQSMALPRQSTPSEGDFPSDRHPRITQLKVTIVRRGETLEPLVVLPDDVVDAREGDLLTIEVFSPADDLQSYYIDGNTPAAERLRSEYYGGQWFRTWGDILAGSSDDPESFNNWDLTPLKDDNELGPNRLAYLYYVVRDGRQGVAWRTLTVRIAPGLELGGN